MVEHKKIHNLSDFFVDLNLRQSKEVYFYRINGYSEDVREFIKKYYEAARRTGVVIEGKIPNPDEKNLAYYNEIMGMDFKMDFEFIEKSLKKWLPRMNDFQRNSVAASIYNALDVMRMNGKNENIQKNAYIKFMCWLYYKFERIVGQLGENNIPKILYEGDISQYELVMISILSNAGCDVVLLQYHGDENYLKLDFGSSLSDNLQMENMQPFPKGYCISQVREELQEDFNRQRLYGTLPKAVNATNVWIKGKGLEDILQNVTFRGNDNRFFYNCFLRVNGVEDKLTYVNELFTFYQELKNARRKVVIVNGEIPKPTPEEISQIKRSNYANQEQMISNLSANIKYTADIEIQRLLHKVFVDTILKESQKTGDNLNKLTNKAVYLLCWLKRYIPDLFSGRSIQEIVCFIYMGGCKNDNEAMLMSFFARLPIDVLILCPDLNVKCCLSDELLYEINNSESMVLAAYPESGTQVRMGTAAYYAERELDTLMYQDTGMYRNRQYSKADAINLQTMYEEIKILWNQELKYRPGFGTVDGTVNIPVIFAKISGVKDGLIPQYWNSVRELITEDTVLVKKAPYIEGNYSNPFRAFAVEFFKNGHLQRERIKKHPKYPYGILREQMQEFILDKLEDFIIQRRIKGILENGMEYTVIAQVLNLPKDIVRLIQKFDFTKKNPKLIYINTSETLISLEDSILTAYLNLIGFDVIFFVPTGYQSIEKYFNDSLPEEHQIGEYLYDMQVPELSNSSFGRTRSSWREKIFKRGN